MPDIYTHIINGSESLKGIQKDVQDAVLKHLELFYLGCMGPDIFYYHCMAPLSKSRLVSKLGGMLHRRHCGRLIAEAFRYIKDNGPDENHMMEKSVYFLGYICHYAMDRTAHPYIFNRSGKYEKHRPETYRFRHSHKVAELAIDCHMAELYGKNDIYKLKLYELIDVGKNLPDYVEDIYHHVMDIFFNNELINLKKCRFVNQAYICFKHAWKLFYDPHHIKKSIFGIFGLDFVMHPRNPCDRDYMNEKRSEWHHPCSNEPDHRMFIQIFDESVRLSTELMGTAIDYLKSGIGLEYFMNKLGNFSFLTNTDVSEEIQHMVYFNPIF